MKFIGGSMVGINASLWWITRMKLMTQSSGCSWLECFFHGLIIHKIQRWVSLTDPDHEISITFDERLNEHFWQVFFPLACNLINSSRQWPAKKFLLESCFAFANITFDWRKLEVCQYRSPAAKSWFGTKLAEMCAIFQLNATTNCWIEFALHITAKVAWLGWSKIRENWRGGIKIGKIVPHSKMIIWSFLWVCLHY